MECRQHTLSITNRGLLSFPTKLVTLAGLEPAAFSFVARRSKFRLSYNAIKVSVMSDSNRRPSPWQGDALPTELMTQLILVDARQFPLDGNRTHIPSTSTAGSFNHLGWKSRSASDKRQAPNFKKRGWDSNPRMTGSLPPTVFKTAAIKPALPPRHI